MKYLTLAIVILMIILVSGCVEQEMTYNESSECLVPSDCEGRIHVQCVGAWQCLNSKCSWQCSGKYLELPKNESEGMTG